jgi:uncharacterized protein
MQVRVLNQGPPRVYAVVLETGEEAVACISRFAREHGLTASQVSAIGAFSEAVIGFFDFATRDYRRIAVRKQVELLSLLGDVADDGGEPKLHVHVVLGRADGSTCGGHLLEARVRPTLEEVITESPGHLRRVRDPATGLTLIRNP